MGVGTSVGIGDGVGDGVGVGVAVGTGVGIEVGSGVGVASPLDLNSGVPSVTLSAMILPAQDPLSPESLAESQMSLFKSSGDLVSETALMISDRPATQLVKTAMGGDTLIESLSVYFVLDSGVLVVQTAANQEHLAPHMPTIEAIIGSVQLKDQ